MNSTLLRVQRSRAVFKYPGGGMITPASPWIGSTRNATVFGPMAASSAALSPNGMTLKPAA